MFLIIGFSLLDVLYHWIDLAAKEGCTFLKDVVDLMDHLTQGDNLTTDEIEIITYHLDVARDTLFTDVTEESNGHDAKDSNEFQMTTQPMVNQFSYFFPQCKQELSFDLYYIIHLNSFNITSLLFTFSPGNA